MSNRTGPGIGGSAPDTPLDTPADVRPGIRPVAGSFRDPAGFVFEGDGGLYRQVNATGAEDYETLVDSGLYEALTSEGLLVAHREVDRGLAADPGRVHKVLAVERVPFVSYPYEWCPGQLRDAGVATLRAQQLALEHGMTLRDASAYNVQFRDGRPVLIDTLSFGVLREGSPWVAYRQLCEHFLAPLALMRHRDVHLGRLLRSDLEGVPLEVAAGLLPWHTRLRPGLLVHVHFHARSRRRASRRQAAGGAPRRARFSRTALAGLADSLRATVERLSWQPARSTWSGYYDSADHYTQAAMATKEQLVVDALEELRPATVWDLGANTGRFARLAARRGAVALAFDADVAAVETAWAEARDRDGPAPLPLVMDLANPSPPVGWGNAERAGLGDRGPADLALALALIHHLVIARNVPLERLVDELARLARDAVVEFVPKQDPKVAELLATREDIFSDYDEDRFEAAVSRRFDITRRQPLPDSPRTLYLLRGRRR